MMDLRNSLGRLSPSENNFKTNYLLKSFWLCSQSKAVDSKICLGNYSISPASLDQMTGSESNLDSALIQSDSSVKERVHYMAFGQTFRNMRE
jgi:hypothetical protein